MPMEGQIDFFEQSLGNPDFLCQLTNNPSLQSQFIQSLETLAFAPNKIIELIKKTNEAIPRSLLIIHLLSRQDYLDQLDGESILVTLRFHKNKESPSRLNEWTHQLLPELLNADLIKKLTLEARINILCSVPHFHRLSEEQIVNLAYGTDTSIFIDWIKHYSHMPNARYVLAQLMKMIYRDEVEALKQNANEEVISQIIRNLNLFSHHQAHLYRLVNKETHLFLAMELYLGGHYYKSYLSLIKNLIKKLPVEDFTPQTIECLFSLSEVKELSELKPIVTPLIMNYVKASAQAGLSQIFYRKNMLQTAQMTQNIHQYLDQNEPNEVIQVLSKNTNSITYLEYFLIHYQGDTNSLQYLLDDYLSDYSRQKKSDARDQVIHQLSLLLTQDKLSDEVKEKLFSALLRQHSLIDNTINYHLFLYHAEKTIRYFGMQGGMDNYRKVQFLCSCALSQTNPTHDEAIIQLAKQAKAEAEFEMELSQDSGFFAKIKNYFKRCIKYGWSGFFSPKTPNFVLPEYLTAHLIETPIVRPNAMKDLATLLNELEQQPLTQEHFIELREALNDYSLQYPPKNDYETRLRLHQLFYKSLINTEQDQELADWLNKNQEPFLRNQFHLLELLLKENSLEEARRLSRQINDDSTNPLKSIANELNSYMPSSIEKTNAPQPEPVLTQVLVSASNAVKSATETLKSTFSWAMCVPLFRPYKHSELTKTESAPAP